MKRLAVIGCGNRSDAYLRQLQPELGVEWGLAAVADPHPARRRLFVEQYGKGPVQEYDDGPALLAACRGRLDAAIIGSVNSAHAAAAVPVFEQRLIALLEKPVATTPADCRTMWQAFRRTGAPPPVVGFVLRYTAFYRAVNRLVQDGSIGQLLTLDATEQMGIPLTSAFLRGWRRFTAQSGGLLIEKCSHDLDLLNLFAGAPARRVGSRTACTHFLPRPDAGPRCSSCRLAASCSYHIDRMPAWTFQAAGVAGPASRDDACVYQIEKDLPDHQTVQIEYANGVLATFTVTMGQPETERTLLVCGSAGRLYGKLHADELVLERHGRPPEKMPVVHDNSGHQGGDSVITDRLKEMLRGEAVAPDAGLREGIDACAIGFAADRSAIEHRFVDVETITA